MNRRTSLFSSIKDIFRKLRTRKVERSHPTILPASKRIQKSFYLKQRKMRRVSPQHRIQLQLDNASPNRKWWQMLIEISAVVAVPTVLLYVLGIVSFWIRIANEYNGIPLSTTWYAASLVPRNIAAASGIEVIVRGLFVYGTSIASGYLFIKRITRPKKAQSGIISYCLPLWLGSVGILTFSLLLLLNENGSYSFLYTLRLVTLCIFLGIVPFVLSVAFEDQEGIRFSKQILSSYTKYDYQTISMIMIVGVFASILFPTSSSLPCLWKEDTDGEVNEANVPNTQSSNEPAAWTLQGGFLSKNEGTWYVLTESDRLQAIPDDQSTRIVSGEFSVRYSKIDAEGLPTGESVAEKDMESGGTYVAVKNCSSFPSQPTIYNF